MKKNNHYSSLDFFRGVCGYGVAITHFYAFVFGSVLMEYTSFLFVEFFFVLSGFVLYPQLLKTLDKKKNLVIFYKRRWLRTLPIYFLTIILVSILTNNLFTKDFLKYLFFIQNFFPNFLTNNYYPVVWSLSIEEFFYILFPILLLNLKKKNFIKIITILLIIFILIKGFFFSDLNLTFYRTGTLLRFDAILIGFFLAHFKNVLLPKSKFIFLSLFLFLILYYYNKNLFLSYADVNWVKFLFISLMQLISVCTLLFFLNINNLFTSSKIKNFSLLVSRQTYSIYLIHIIFIYLMRNLNLSSFVLVVLYILLLAIFSSLIYELIEKPILKIRPKLK